MRMTRMVIGLCALALALVSGGAVFAQTTDVDAYILDPNWYAWHPQLTSPQVYGVGVYEYGVAGSRGGDEGPGVFGNTESNPDNYNWGIYGYFRKPSMGIGNWTLATWSRWWRPAFLFQTPYPWTNPSKPILRLHANMWSYGTSWPGNTYTPGAGPWNETGQTFTATGNAITMIVIRSPLAGISWTATVRDGGPGGAQIGPARYFTSPSGPSDVRLFYSGNEIPTVPGQTYYLRLKASGATQGIFCESEPIPDMSDPMPNGCVYHDGVADPTRDLGLTICSDDDGIVTGLNIDKSAGYPGTVGSCGQTFTARGTSLLYFGIYLADHSTDYVATLYDGISGGFPGPKIGFAKRNSYVRYGDPEVLFVWEPNECPLTPGHTYYIEVTRAGGGQLQFIGNSSDAYSGGECYANRMVVGGWDVSGCIMEEQSPGSAMKSTVQFTTTPAVAFADRGTRSMTVRWTTDVASDSTIEYGAWNADYTSTYTNSALVTNHVATITGLQPNTMYHFRVKSGASLYKTGVTRDLQACTINETANLLSNPSFEEGSGNSPRAIASPPWYYGGLDTKASSGNWFAGVPPYAGTWLCEAAVNNSNGDGYLYQTIPAIPGVDYSFTLAFYSHMIELNHPKYDVFYNSGRIDYVKIGIDPTGGTDRNSANVKWTPTFYSQQRYTTLGTHAVAAASQITVFVNMVGRGGVANTWHIYGIDDCRVSANYPAATPIATAKGDTADGPVTVSDLIITATPAEAGAYYAENADRTQGIRIESTQTVAVGARVTVSGVLTTDADTHERSITSAVFTSSVADTAPKPMVMQAKSIGGAALGSLIPALPDSFGPHNTGLVVRIAGKVTAKDPGGSAYVWLNDGSLPGDGIKVDTSRVAPVNVPGVGDDVAISGISSLYSDFFVKPLLIARRASDITP